MSFINSYKPKQPTIPHPDAPYDINFIGPLPPIVDTARVKLIPFIPALHLDIFFATIKANPEINVDRYLPFTITTADDFALFIELYLRSSPSCILYSIIDRTKPNADENLKESLAGIIGLIHFDPINLSAEIGPVVVAPAYQRTFVATNAIGILIRACLDLPSEGGLGFRRLAWGANPNNTASIRTAERLGFKMEGCTRWAWILKPGKEGRDVTGSGRGEGPGRDTVTLSICWDDYEDGAKELVKRQMDRV